MDRNIRFHPIALVEPGPAINTTPLIDLMLVLLVMFIVSIPIATHKVPLDVPTRRDGPPSPVHRLDLDVGGNLFWDGAPIADAALAPHLVRMVEDPAAPVLHIAVDSETRYERVDEILAVIARAGVTNMGFVGNERFAAMMDGPAR